LTDVGRDIHADEFAPEVVARSKDVAATATETFKLLCRAYALSERERQVVAALVAGLDTRAVAQRLFISRYTIQDHLKSVFTKTGVRSRRELLARFAGTHDTTPTARN